MLRRSASGSTIVLIAAVTLGLVVSLIFFCLNYTRLIGSNAEQKKAIEAAALAAANDMSDIVVNTKEFGFVSLSDQAPIGKATAAGDLYYLPVHGINTLVGTARLDAVIADNLPNSGIMATLAQNDLKATQKVIAQLSAVLSAALTKTGSPLALDRDGNPRDIYLDAENAYKRNDVRMTGSASYVANSMTLTLGSITTPGETNVPVPQPTATAPVPGNLQTNGFYNSFVNVPFNGVNYVFGGIGDSTRLVDVRNFAVTVPGLAYQVPTIVRAEADQLITTSQTTNGSTIRSAACAQPSSVFDPKPAPGALAIEFPDGALPEFLQPADLLSYNGLAAGPAGKADILTSQGGDFPSDFPACYLNNSPDPWPTNIASTSMQDVWRCAFYDWIRRAGTKARIDQVTNMQTLAFAASKPPTDWWAQLDPAITTFTNITSTLPGPQIPFGIMHVYKWDPSGNIMYKSLPEAPYPYEIVAENQLYAEVAGNKPAFKSTVPTILFKNLQIPSIDDKGNGKVKNIKGDITFEQNIDVYVRDQCREIGTLSGGKHGGEPVEDTLVTMGDSPRTIADVHHDYGDKGSGAGGGSGSPPLLAAQSDFGDPQPQIPPKPFVTYTKGPATVRPTYRTTGLCGSIRFRRQVQVKGQIASYLGTVLYKDIGYVGQKRATPTVTYVSTDPRDVTDDFGSK